MSGAYGCPAIVIFGSMTLEQVKDLAYMNGSYYPDCENKIVVGVKRLNRAVYPTALTEEDLADKLAELTAEINELRPEERGEMLAKISQQLTEELAGIAAA